ncbi:MAG TPA: cytochrome c family protein [Phycisphaerae bacterium]|jgi:cytochrome c5
METFALDSKAKRWRHGLVISACAVFAGAWGIASWAERALADGQASGDKPTGASPAQVAAAGKNPEYVGTKTCRMCHDAEHKSWEKTQMAKAFETLAPGAGKEIRVKAGLDPDKDYRQDAVCLACHTVGFGKSGGYAVSDPSDKKAVNQAKSRENVGCECCHGAGSEYVKIFKEVAESGRKYKVEELYAVGLIKPGENMCTGCHNESSTGAKAGLEKFDYDKMRAKGIHDLQPLKQRE